MNSMDAISEKFRIRKCYMIDSRWLVFVAAISGFVCVGIGAMGAHSLPKRLQDSGLSASQVQKKVEQCETAVKYQMYHSIVVLVIGLSPALQSSRTKRIACTLFLVGVCLFSGGLYSLVFFDTLGHWSIVPLGGATFMFAWLTLGFGALFSDKSALGTGEMGT